MQACRRLRLSRAKVSASGARSANGAETLGMEARRGETPAGGSMRSTIARPRPDGRGNAHAVAVRKRPFMQHCRRCHFQKTTAPVHEAGRPVCSRLLTGSCQQSYARNSKKGGNCAELPCTTLRNGLACAMVSCAVSCNHTCNQWRAPCHQFTNQR